MGAPADSRSRKEPSRAQPSRGQPSRGQPSRGGPLEWLRFLAAAFIVVYHFGDDAPVHLDHLARMLGQGWLATDFFLMLSGYVLARAYGAALDERRIGAAAFLERRLTRVWPAHLIVLLGFALLVFASGLFGIEPAHPRRYYPEDFWLQALLVHAWGFSTQGSWNVPSWSLSALVVCYALFPAAWRLTRGLAPAVALGAAPLLLLAAALTVQAVTGRALYDLDLQLALLRAIPLFLTGLLLGRAAPGLRVEAPAALTIMAAGLGVIVAVETAGRGAAGDFASVIAIALIIMAADAWKAPRSRIAATGARLSFSLFITHALTGAVWFGVVRLAEARWPMPVEAQWLLWLAAFPVALGAAWLFDRLVDAPVQAALARLRSRRGRYPAPAPSG